MSESLWTVRDLAGYLKTTCHGVYKLVERRRVPHIRLGRRVLFVPGSVQQWLLDQSVSGER